MPHQKIHLATIIGAGYMVPMDPGVSEEQMVMKFLKAADDGDEIATQALLDCTTLATHPSIGHHSGAFIMGEKHKGRLYIRPAQYPNNFKQGQGLQYLQSRAETSISARMQLTYLMRARMDIPGLEVT